MPAILCHKYNMHPCSCICIEQSSSNIGAELRTWTRVVLPGILLCPPKPLPSSFTPYFCFLARCQRKLTMRLRLPNVPHLQLAKQLAPILLPSKNIKKSVDEERRRFGKRTTDCVCGVNGFTFISFVCAWVWVRVCMLVCDESTHFWAWQCFYCSPPTIKATTLVRLSTSAKALSLSRFGRFACCCQAASWMNVPNCEKYPQLNLLGTEKDVEIGLNSLLTIMKINTPKSLIIGWEHY